MQDKIDLKLLRTAGIAFLTSIGVTVGLIVGSGYFEDTQKVNVRKESLRVRSMQRKHASATEDIKEVGIYFPQFETLRKRGIVGEADRVKWVETLGKEAKEMNLTSLRYAISPATEFRPKFAFILGDIKPMTSGMTISMDLLHEEDLLNLLARLEESNQGLYIVSDCEMTRTVMKIRRNSAAPNLGGECTLQWFNIQSRSEDWVEILKGDSQDDSL